MTFEEWLRSYFSDYEVDNELGNQQYTNLSDCWSYQQDKIQEMQEVIDKQSEALRFYGDKDNWEPNNYRENRDSMFDAFFNNDEERIDSRSYGGKKAREVLSDPEVKKYTENNQKLTDKD